MGGARWWVAMGLGLVQVFAAAGARAEPVDPGGLVGLGTSGDDGVWAGRETGAAAGDSILGQPGSARPSANWVTLQLRGKALIFTDARSVWVGTSTWQIGGPGTKAGALDFDVAWKLQAALTLNGGPSRIRPGQKSLLRVRLDPGGATLAFCMTPPGSPAKRPSSASDAGAGHGIRCFDLKRVAVAPPVPAAEPDFECMRECRQQNMARAVSADQIDADCRRACAPR